MTPAMQRPTHQNVKFIAEHPHPPGIPNVAKLTDDGCTVRVMLGFRAACRGVTP